MNPCRLLNNMLYEGFIANKNEDLLKVIVLSEKKECFAFIPEKYITLIHIGQKCIFERADPDMEQLYLYVGR